jgi:glycosyltransferase involved in cell wall biosynthesis
MSAAGQRPSSGQLKATISVLGRFHAFYLARSLQEAGCLDQLITSYPRFETVKYGVRPEHIRSLLVHELAARLWRKLPAPLRALHDITHQNFAAFDWNVARRLDGRSSVFVGWSGASLRSLRRARELGMKTFLERGSSHMVYQQEIIAEEYALNGLKYQGHHPAITERELIEYETADYVCVPSQYVRGTFIERGFPAERLLVNPYGVDLEHFPRHEKPDDVFRVVFCGALSIRKGLAYLLRAFSELSLPNSELLLIGSRQSETEPLLARYASDNIRHIGPFQEFDLHKHYRLGSVFCMPSIEEGLAMVQVQALASGLPLICTTNTGGGDLITDGEEGFVVRIRDVEALKEKILFCYENPDARAAMADAARARVEDSFSWSDHGERAMAHYRHGLDAS